MLTKLLPNLLTVAGVLTGGVVWVIIYAINFSAIEFDSPAWLGLVLGLCSGGAVLGLIGVVYALRHERSFVDVLTSFIVVLVFSVCAIGFVLGSYAQQRWDYAAANRAVCNAPEDVRPLACQ